MSKKQPYTKWMMQIILICEYLHLGSWGSFADKELLGSASTASCAVAHAAPVGITTAGAALSKL
jgi:hypothetical protein